MTDEEIVAFVEKRLRIASESSVLPERRPWKLPEHSVTIREFDGGRDVYVLFPSVPYCGSVFMRRRAEDRNSEYWDNWRLEFAGLAESLVNQLANIGPCEQDWGVPCRAVPCRAVPCRAVPCRAVPCRAVPCWGAAHMHWRTNGGSLRFEFPVCEAHRDVDTKEYRPRLEGYTYEITTGQTVAFADRRLLK